MGVMMMVGCIEVRLVLTLRSCSLITPEAARSANERLNGMGYTRIAFGGQHYDSNRDNSYHRVSDFFNQTAAKIFSTLPSSLISHTPSPSLPLMSSFPILISYIAYLSNTLPLSSLSFFHLLFILLCLHQPSLLTPSKLPTLNNLTCLMSEGDGLYLEACNEFNLGSHKG